MSAAHPRRREDADGRGAATRISSGNPTATYAAPLGFAPGTCTLSAMNQARAVPNEAGRDARRLGAAGRRGTRGPMGAGKASAATRSSPMYAGVTEHCSCVFAAANCG